MKCLGVGVVYWFDAFEFHNDYSLEKVFKDVPDVEVLQVNFGLVYHDERRYYVLSNIVVWTNDIISPSCSFTVIPASFVVKINIYKEVNGNDTEAISRLLQEEVLRE